MNTSRDQNLAKSTLVEESPKTLILLKENTIQTYRINYKRLLSRAHESRSMNIDEPAVVIPMDLVDDWIASVNSVSSQTANMHRSALMWVFQNDKFNGWEAAYERLKSIRQASIRNSHPQVDGAPVKRSRPPGRMIPEEDLQTLINTFFTMGKSGMMAQWFLLAGVASGARPIEWPDAHWVDSEKSVIRFYTAKVKNRNAWDKIPALTFNQDDQDQEINELWSPAKDVEHSTAWNSVDFERRIATLDLSEDELAELRKNRVKNSTRLFRDVYIEPQYRRYVSLHMEEIKRVVDEARNEEAYKDTPTETLFRKLYFEQARHGVWRACQTAFKGEKLYSLADTRSTFSANRKAQNGNVAAAAELGHTITTSKNHYAPARKSWSRYKPQPGQTNTQAEQSIPTPSASAPGKAGPKQK